jgi:hypothetical protein
MATILQQNQQDDEEQQNQQGQQAPTVSSAQSANISGQSAGNVGASPSQRQASTSGRFTNIQNFIRANEGNQLGQQVAGKVQESAQGAQEKLGQTQQAFQGQIGQVAQGVQASKDQASEAIKSISGAGDYNVDDATADQAIENLRAGINQQYQGPSGLGNQQQLAAEAQNLYGIGKASQDASGRSALLQRFFGRERPTYSAGQTNLDNLLLGAQNKGLAQVRQTSRQFGGQLRDAQQQALTNVMEQQSAVKSARDFAKQQAQAAAQGSLTDLEKEAEQFLYAEQLRRNTGPEGLSAILNPGTVRGATAADPRGPLKDGEQGVRARSQEFELSGFGDRALTGKDLVNLGITGFQSQLGDVSSLTPEQARQFAGRVNVQQATQLNKLRSLLGENALQTGPQLQAGSYSAVDSGRLSNINAELGAEIARLAGTDSNLLKQLNAPKVSQTAPGTGLAGPTAIGPTLQSEQKRVYNQALQNILSKYRPQGFGTFA